VFIVTLCSSIHLWFQFLEDLARYGTFDFYFYFFLGFLMKIMNKMKKVGRKKMKKSSRVRW
jgi:hypothetical protein